ncbi:MAG: hemerythrin domain-containing protein [Candidatus Sumerlaeaceae bacterium]
MSSVGLETSLNALAAAAPELATVLERFGITPQAYQEQSLGWALEVLGFGANEAALVDHAALWRDACEVCWQTTTVDDIIEHILRQHHAYLRLELPRLQMLLHRAVNRESTPSARVAHTLLDAFVPLKAELEMHLLKEEQILFPLIRDLAAAAEPFQSHCGSVRNPISVMMTEHDNAKEALQRFRQATLNFRMEPELSPLMRALYAGLAQLERDLLAHIREEDGILFPRSIAIEDELFNR